jgi:glutaconate CoA-transferase subunit B
MMEKSSHRIGDTLVAAAYLMAPYHRFNLFSPLPSDRRCRQPAPLSLTYIEKLWLDRSLCNIGFVRIAADVLPRLRPMEFFRPAQIDMHGNTNNLAFGKDPSHPRLRLPGAGGIPDVTTFISDIHLYVPRHSRVTFVPHLDFLSGMGYNPARKTGRGPRYLVTDLGQFDFFSETGNDLPRMRLTSYHPGVTISQVQARTGFELLVAAEIAETPPPSSYELELLRTEIDPLGIRRLESLSGAERRELLHDILRHEKVSPG